MKFDFAKSVLAPTEVLTAEAFNELIASQELREKMLRVHNALGNKKEYAIAKRALPVVMWQAHFADGKRHSESAEPSGLYMLDIDHISLVRQAEIRAKAEEIGLDKLGIYIIHRTPSEEGLRFVSLSPSGLPTAPCHPSPASLRLRHLSPVGERVRSVSEEGENTSAGGERAVKAPTIAECQQWLAEQLELLPEEVDTACKDMARCSFLPSREYFLYINPKVFTDEARVLPSTEAPTHAEALPPRGSGEGVAGGGSQTSYKGIPLTDIARKYFDLTGGLPVEGERHQRYLDCARVLRYICDFKASVLYKALVTLGYEDTQDLARICQDACDKMGSGSQKPAILQRILKEFNENENENENCFNENDDEGAAMPELPKVLPPIFSEYVRIAPADFKAASFVALLPVLGTVFTHLRGRYLDGKLKSPSFMAVVEAPQASGKSFLEAIVEQMLHAVKMQDEISWGIWRKYIQDKKLAKNADRQPEEPECMIRLIPATISLTMYLQRQLKSQGKHLFSFIPEIATLTRTNSAGAWSQKTEMYRLAFDNAEFGQDYASDNSFSGVVRVFYNWLASGTPMDVKKFFRNSEDGLVSRVVFCKLPDQLGAKMPVWGQLDGKELAGLQRLVKVTGEERIVEYDLPYLNASLEEWQEGKRQEVLRSGDRALDIFRRRAAQIGFQAGVLFHHLFFITSKAKKPMVTAAQKRCVATCARWVADWTLMAQYDKFAKEVNEEQSAPKALGRKSLDIFALLPGIFSQLDVQCVCDARQVKTPARHLLYTWRKANMVIYIDKQKRMYKKV